MSCLPIDEINIITNNARNITNKEETLKELEGKHMTPERNHETITKTLEQLTTVLEC